MNSSHRRIIPDQCHRSDPIWDHKENFLVVRKTSCTYTRSTMNPKLKQKINSKCHITVKTLNIHNKKNNTVCCKRKKENLS